MSQSPEYFMESVHASTAYSLLAALQNYAPNASAQALVSEIYNSAYATHRGEGQPVVKLLAGILLDGLSTGNWPWALPQPRFTSDSDTDEQLVVEHLLKAAALAARGDVTAHQEVRDDTETLVSTYNWRRESVHSYIDHHASLNSVLPKRA